MKISSKTINFISLFQYVILIIILFILVLFSSDSFKNVNDSKNFNYNYRSQLAYITNKVKSSNFTGGVQCADNVLILRDSDDKSEYETKIYFDNNRILEEYSKAEQELNPEKATVIGTSTVFDVKMDKGLVYLTTDLGTVAIGVKAVES